MFRWTARRQVEGITGFIRELVFGLEDGIVSTGGAVIGIAAGTGDWQVVILSGLVIVIVEALSMAAGTYLSGKSTRQLAEGRVGLKREAIERDPEGERRKLAAEYRRRGFGEAEAEVLVGHMTRSREVWLEEMACKELGLSLGDLGGGSGNAGVMWVSYMVGGTVPIVPFLLLPVGAASAVAFGLSLVGLFAIGWWKARVTGTSAWRGGAEMMLVAAAAGVVGFIVGRLIGALTGIDLTV
ncbi:MAG: VIT1/CCC1 transporter family protein [bacterium]